MPTVDNLITPGLRRHRASRVLALVVAVAAVLAVGAACGGDDDAGDANAPADGSGEGEGQDEGDADFVESVTAAQETLEAAADPCDVADALNDVAATGNPESPEEIELAVAYYVTLLNTMADTGSDPAVAEALRSGARGFAAFAAENDNDLEALDLSGDGPDYPEAEATEAAINEWVNAELAACFDQTGTTEPPA